MNSKKFTELLLTSKVLHKVQFVLPQRFVAAEVSGQSLNKTNKLVGYWLLGCSALSAGGLALGGITRLSEGKFSMFNWDLHRTQSAPKTHEAWQAEFEEYHQKRQKVADAPELTFEDFKWIRQLESVHRCWGQMLGLVFLVPAVYFAYKGRFDKRMQVKMGLAAVLLGGHLVDGWKVLQSGLGPKSQIDTPHISQYRMLAHLSATYGLYALFLWSGFTHLLPPMNHSSVQGIARFRTMTCGAFGALTLTVLLGGMVASLDAGRIYNTWPGFKGTPKNSDTGSRRLIPNEIVELKPMWRNLVENQTTIQFMHRHAAYFTLATVTLTWLTGRRLALSPRARMALNAMFAMGLAQAGIGITTLLNAVPTALGSLHQQGSVTMVTLAIWLMHEIRRLPK